MSDEIEVVTLAEPLTEFTAQMWVDIFDGNVFLVPIPTAGTAACALAIAGVPVDPAEIPAIIERGQLREDD